MNVLGLLGSPRKDGNTSLLLERLLEGAKEAGAEVEKVFISELNITPCREHLNCEKTGECPIRDRMQELYPKLLEADVVVLASPIFFYGVTAQAKALIDRCQALWARKYLLKQRRQVPDRDSSDSRNYGASGGDRGGRVEVGRGLVEGGRRRKGFFLALGGTKGKKLFDGAILTAKYFFDAIDVQYVGELTYRSVDAKGDILKHPAALEDAYRAGRMLAGIR